MNRAELLVEVAACLAEPDEAAANGALLVLADRLQLDGDPDFAAVGELIAAQLSPAKRPSAKRMKALEMAALRAWLGPLADGAIDRRAVTFARGLPTRIVLVRATAGRALEVADPLWAIVDGVDLERAPVELVAPLLPRLARAHTIEGALPRVVAAFADTRPPAMTRLGCYLGRGRSAAGAYVVGGPLEVAIAAVSVDRALVELRHGDHFEARDHEWLWRSPLAGRLATFSASNIYDRLIWGELALWPWLDALAAAPANLARFVLTEHLRGDFDPIGGWAIEFTRGRGATGPFDTLHASYAGGPSRIRTPAERLAGGLARAPRSKIARLTFGAVPASVRAELAVLPETRDYVVT